MESTLGKEHSKDSQSEGSGSVHFSKLAQIHTAVVILRQLANSAAFFMVLIYKENIRYLSCKTLLA